MHKVPIRHGMTIGEIALMINEKNWLGPRMKCDLHIVKMQGWNRNMYFDDTNQSWISPSPNIPDLETAILYSGLCLIEGTNLSEGRGTGKPFKVIGSPWLDSDKIIDEMKKYNFQGVKITKTSFVPKSIKGKSLKPKYMNEKCNAIEIKILDRDILDPIKLSIRLLDIIYKIHPYQFKFLDGNFIDKLYGSDKLRNYILNGNNIDLLFDNWITFENEEFLLY